MPRKKRIYFQLKSFDGKACHRFGVNKVQTGCNGNILFSAGRDGAVRCWSLNQNKAPKLRLVVEAHSDWVNDLVLVEEEGACGTHQPHFLISASNDRKIKLWDVQDLDSLICLHTVTLHRDYVKCLAYAHQNRTLVSAGLDHSVYIWDLHHSSSPVAEMQEASKHSGKESHPALCQTKDIPQRVSVYGLSVGASGNLVAVGTIDSAVRIWDARSAEKVCKLKSHSGNVRSLVLDEVGNQLLSASSDGDIRHWDIRHQKQCIQVFRPTGKSVWCLEPVWSGGRLHGFFSGGISGAIHFFDLENGLPPSQVCKLGAETLSLSYRASKQSLWVGTTSSIISEWETKGRLSQKNDQTCRLLTTIKGKQGHVSHAVLNNQRHILTKSECKETNGTGLSLWDVATGQERHIFQEDVSLEVKKKELDQRVWVRPWFSVDKKLGVPCLMLEQNSAFNGEIYETELRNASRHDDLESEAKANLGALMLKGLFKRWYQNRYALLSQRHQMQKSRSTKEHGLSDSEDEDAMPAAQHKLPPMGPDGDPEAFDVPDRTLIWIAEIETDVAGNQENVIAMKHVNDFDGTEGEDIIPTWVVDCVWRGLTPTPKDVKKVSFILFSQDEIDAAAGDMRKLSKMGQRLTAPGQMRAQKVIAYILSQDQFEQYKEEHNKIPTIKLSCRGRSIHGSDYLAAVERDVFKDTSQEMILVYRAYV
mmetsp:Transcript_10619/g.13783  ORF Transcript_10619/g.13783 Transcript_10619/m.13783 type:complete len:702 (+) Transcript_10619:201-2306(+)